MPIKIVVFYYSQTGQATMAAKNLFANADSETTIVYKPIVPIKDYPFPWSKYDFFDIFPETRLGMPPSGIHAIDFSDVEDADLTVIVGQSWFLSPSMPLQSFFADKYVKKHLCQRKVIFVNVCRNMWVMTNCWLKEYLKNIHAEHIGHIVLQDHAPNLISAATIVRWLMHGEKEASGILPVAGVTQADLTNTARFGDIIEDCARKGKYNLLQERLLVAGGIKYSPSILFIERIGYRIFGMWAKFIRKKGGIGDLRRKHRVWLFYYYLLFVLFVVSPFVQLIFYLTYPFRGVKRQKAIDCNL